MLHALIEALPFVAIGFVAQMFDGAIGMGFGAISYAVLRGIMGLPPAVVSASVNGAKIITGAASGLGHIWNRNVDWRLFAQLAAAGSIGGIIGSFLLARGPIQWIGPAINLYLVGVGAYIIYKANYPKAVEQSPRKVLMVGGAGGLLEALAGVWGPLVTSNLVAFGSSSPRFIIGSGNLAEMVVAVVVFIVLVSHLGLSTLTTSVIGLIIGAIIAAPLAARFTRTLPPRTLMISVGILVIATSLLRVARYFWLDA